jgi:hypothetical protein
MDRYRTFIHGTEHHCTDQIILLLLIHQEVMDLFHDVLLTQEKPFESLLFGLY